MKAIGAGFGRTGTMSLKAALEQLGAGPCFHMIDIIRDQSNLPHWQAAVDGERVDWREALRGWRSSVDWPGCTFYERHMETWPDALVLLTVREPEASYRSMSIIWEGTFQGRFEDKDHALKVFNDHIEDVKRTVPADLLVLYEVGQGWGPLADI